MANTTNHHIPTIVYVEDNAGDAVLLEEALRERGHATQLLVIEKGDKALHYFEVKASARDLPPPHCILLDSHLPMVTGSQLLRFIRGSDAYVHTPVYIFADMTGYQDLLHAGIVSRDSFISKPSDWQQFLELANLLMRSAEANQQQVANPQTNKQPELPASGLLQSHDATLTPVQSKSPRRNDA